MPLGISGAQAECVSIVGGDGDGPFLVELPALFVAPSSSSNGRRHLASARSEGPLKKHPSSSLGLSNLGVPNCAIYYICIYVLLYMPMITNSTQTEMISTDQDACLRTVMPPLLLSHCSYYCDRIDPHHDALCIHDTFACLLACLLALK
jgi:hypothetical protein